jgi:UDP-4-amino-4,6-dideoxy-N-acetyl-beta-L-altrosamine transaminase
MPYSCQQIDEADIEAVARVLRSAFLTTGPAVEAFEEALATRCKARFAVTFSSGTAALHGAYAAAGVGQGDTIVTTPITYAATGNAALLLGARPVFADVDPATSNLDAAAAEAAIGERTKALVPVDYAGRPADLAAFRDIADRHDLVFVQDAAHSLGARYAGAPVGAQADLTILSFHPVKAITTGEGGAVLTDDEDRRDHLRRFRSHGMERDKARFEGPVLGAWQQEMQILGLNYRLTDIQCALGLSQLGKLDGFLARRRQIAAHYGEALSGVAGIDLPPPSEDSAWHLYPVRFHVERPEAKAPLFDALRARGLGVQVHYPPVYLHPHYARLGYAPGACPVAERFAVGEISIPLYPGMSDADVERVVDAVRTVAQECA